MSNDPSPLKYMGTQSQETVNMAAALARATEQAAGQTTDTLAGKVDKARSSVADASSGISAAANWAVDKAKDAAYAAAGLARKRATKAVESYTRDDPIRALLIAAGAGALLMVLLGSIARSGARSARRKARGWTQ
jgi:ElaB/YqjD/DUF883 family membrane-anchored ribosome-binding protein